MQIWQKVVNGEKVWNNNVWSHYKYEPVISGLKSYVVGEAITSDKFGGKELQIISAKKDTNGKNRFYVMALEDVDDSKHYWYKNCEDKLDNLESDIDFGQDIPKGKTNTDAMIENWNLNGTGDSYGEQDPNDMWGIIQQGDNLTKYGLEWFVASRAEWSAFGDMIWTKFEEDYSNLNLKDSYFSSSQLTTYSVYYAGFWCSNMGDAQASARSGYIRLSATF